MAEKDWLGGEMSFAAFENLDGESILVIFLINAEDDSWTRFVLGPLVNFILGEDSPFIRLLSLGESGLDGCWIFMGVAVQESTIFFCPW